MCPFEKFRLSFDSEMNRKKDDILYVQRSSFLQNIHNREEEKK